MCYLWSYFFVAFFQFFVMAQPPLPPSPATPPSAPQEEPLFVTSFDFQDADIKEVIKVISKLTGKNFIMGAQVSGKVTIISPPGDKLTIDEAYRAFLSALEINNLTVVPVGRFLKIIRATDAFRDGIETFKGPYTPGGDAWVTRIYHLKYVRAADVSQTMVQLTKGRVLAYDPTNTLIMTDTAVNIQRLLDIIKALDVKGHEERMEVLAVRFASAKEIADQITQLIDEGGARGFRPVPSFQRPPGSPLGEGTGKEIISKMIPDTRTNSIIVKANEQGIQKVRDLIAKLDVEVTGGGKIHIFYLQNSDAKKVAETLASLTSGGRGASPSSFPGGAKAPLPVADLEGEIRITADEDTNSLVVAADPQDFETLKQVIQKLDIPRKQVFVDAAILEVTINGSRSLGISYHAGVPAPNGSPLVVGFQNSQASTISLILNQAQALSGVGALGFFGGKSIKIRDANNVEREVPTLAALISLIEKSTDSNLISTPRLLAMDNEEAEIVVTEKIPVQTQLPITTGNITQPGSISREDIGLSLKIKPQINETSDFVRLKIEQSLEDLSSEAPPTTGLAGLSIRTTKRATNTTVVVRDGDTIVLSGLIRDNTRVTSEKIPLLGDIPVLGWLFRSKKNEANKTNLLVFITPTIVREYADQREIFDEKIKERSEFMKHNYPGEDDKKVYINKFNPPSLKPEQEKAPVTIE